MSIEQFVKTFKETGSKESFDSICFVCIQDFNMWYRNVQRFVKTDRQSLLCEFLFILWRSVRKYKTDKGFSFLHYFRSALKKHALFLNRKNKSKNKTVSIKDTSIADYSYLNKIASIDIEDSIQNLFDGVDKEIVNKKMMGFNSLELQKDIGLSEFKFKKAMKNIKLKSYSISI